VGDQHSTQASLVLEAGGYYNYMILEVSPGVRSRWSS
jgi:hypothetical protein